MDHISMEHPGVYVNIIIAILGAVWALLTGLIVYIWRSSTKSNESTHAELEKRTAALEAAKSLALDKLLLNPVLTIPVHAVFCGEVWARFLDRVALMEENIGLKIEKAILESAKNGRCSLGK